MTALLVIGLVIAAYLLGRLIQWVRDARGAMNSWKRR